MKERSRILLHPFFIMNLLLLLLNDIYWKYEYHNWLTGKLSDFSGLIVLSLFLTVFLPNKKAVLFFCVLLFVWWKSPMSQSLIDHFNGYWQIPVRRVIDYTDLFALTVLPCIYFLKPLNFKLPFHRLAINGIGMVCLFCFLQYLTGKTQPVFNSEGK